MMGIKLQDRVKNVDIIRPRAKFSDVVAQITWQTIDFENNRMGTSHR